MNYIGGYRTTVEDINGACWDAGQDTIIAAEVLEGQDETFAVQLSEGRVKIITCAADGIVETGPGLGEIIIENNRQVGFYVVTTSLKEILGEIACPVCGR